MSFSLLGVTDLAGQGLEHWEITSFISLQRPPLLGRGCGDFWVVWVSLSP